MVKSPWHVCLWILFSFCLSSEAFSQPLTARLRIQQCWQSGAVTTELMQMCSGLHVDPPTFTNCMQGGPCFGEWPIAPAPGQPFCGGPNMPFCLSHMGCNQPGSIPCPPPPGVPFPPFLVAWGCGSPGFPPCQVGRPCGLPGTLVCYSSPAVIRGLKQQAAYAQLNPFLEVVLPGRPGDIPPGGLPTGVQFALPPLPDEGQLRACSSDSDSSNEFYECVVEHAMPRAYRIVSECRDEHPKDGGRALICSTENPELMDAYEKIVGIKECTEDNERSGWDVAQCIGDQTLGENERYYLGCVTRNRGDLTKTAVCGLAKNLNPEQQIALACAISSGGEPHAFAVCTGGQLLERELNKCWQHGIATASGCFGPNNEYSRLLRSADQQMRRTLGENSVLYHAYQAWHHNVLAPGENHEIVKVINNGIRDVRNGPGENNEFVKAGKALEKGFRSVGKVFGF